MNERYDIAIIGCSPAGLSAALNRKIRNKKLIIFGSRNLSPKLEKAPEINNYLGFYGVSGELVPGHKIVDRHIEVDRMERTNISGCFAAGDCIGTHYQFIKAAGEGNIAALSAVLYLDEMK